jgi:3-hydroxyisobutyrate dehydrogenase-like beta-hydroxyacid dehydrogenase
MNISVLGLGIIGATWAQHFHNDGFSLKTWNRTPQPDFVGFVPTVEDAVTDADFVFVVVSDPAAVESVLERARPNLKKGAIIVQSSTISPTWTKKFSADVESVGARFLEAPFTGSKPAAQARQCVFYLGGDNELVEEAKPVLEKISKAQLHVGKTGDASALKLAMNLNIAGISQTLTEAITFTRKAGLSDEIFFQALDLNVSKSGLSDLKKPKLETSDYSPQFSLKHMGKDLRLAIETAGENDLELPQTARLKALYDLGIEKGFGDDDFVGLIRLLEDK